MYTNVAKIERAIIQLFLKKRKRYIYKYICQSIFVGAISINSQPLFWENMP